MKYLLPVLILSCCISCRTHSDNWDTICNIENYIESRPDSALAVLETIDTANLASGEERAKYALYLSMALDKNYIDKTGFDVLQPAVDYYENHGSATDKLRTFYYQGRIFCNRGDSEKAMECFVKSIELGSKSDDLSTKARNYNAQSLLYSQYYNWRKYVQCSIAAAEYFKTLDNIDAYFRMLCKASEGYMFIGDTAIANMFLSECHGYLNRVNDRSKAYYYCVCLIQKCNENQSKEEISSIIREYLNLVPTYDVDWVTIANAYLSIEDVSSAKKAIDKYTSQGNIDKRYYAVLTQIYKAEGAYKDALKSYEQYNHLTDSLDFIALEQDTQFIEERHQLEMAQLKEHEKRMQTTTVFVMIVFILIVVAIWISSRLRLSRMNMLISEKEAEKYRLLYAQMEDESDNLNMLLLQNKELDTQARNAIAKRLELLNKFFTAHITDNSDIDRKASKEIEELLEDKDRFMDSTRLAYAGSHPKFIKYLEERGLTEREINYCCLYALGLKGKEVGAYIKMRSHYNNSTGVREKLGISEHDTNLGIYIRKLVKSFSE